MLDLRPARLSQARDAQHPARSRSRGGRNRQWLKSEPDRPPRVTRAFCPEQMQIDLYCKTRNALSRQIGDLLFDVEHSVTRGVERFLTISLRTEAIFFDPLPEELPDEGIACALVLTG